VNPSSFGNIYPGAWTSPSDQHDYPYLLIPNSMATESYLELSLLDASMQTETWIERKRNSSIPAPIDVSKLSPTLGAVEHPKVDDPSFRWSVEDLG
jgi:hypothetical protein